MSDKISTGLGHFSKNKFDALLNVRASALKSIRNSLNIRGFTEVLTASLVNIAGSCENPNHSFTLNYYGREAHLSQSAQIQLESLVLRLHRAVFTVNSSFREENYDDPEMTGRRLSEFTLIEPETPMIGKTPEAALDDLIALEEAVVKGAVSAVLAECQADVASLTGNLDYLAQSIAEPFARITYDEALALLNRGGAGLSFGHDLNIREERELLRHFEDRPVFVTHFPAAIKFFNMKRTQDNLRVYSVDLLMPRLGETTGGAVREDDVDRIKDYLMLSKVAEMVNAAPGGDVFETFREYLQIFDSEPGILRAGFGIGFERFIGFLLQSNDILETIAYRTLRPG